MPSTLALAYSNNLVFRPTPHAAINFSRGGYTVKTVTSRRELLQVLRLRYDVFHREYKNKKFPFGIDKDRYDSFADHLVIVDDKSRRIVGTYRMIPSTRGSEFYSASEFDISAVVALPGIKVELSRACIARDFRNGVVISLLWRGLVQYVQQTGADYLFGMGSVKTLATDEILATYRELSSQGAISDQIWVPTVGKYRVDAVTQAIIAGIDSHPVSQQGSAPAASLIPTLLRSYIKAGAKVCGEPAVDRDFNCTDFFTLLDMSSVSKAYERKFLQ